MGARQRLQDGFLTYSFSKNDIDFILNENEAVVAEAHLNIIGYYLVYNNTGHKIKHLKIIESLVDKGILTCDISKIGIGVQALIDLEWQGKNILFKMLETLLELTKNNYEYLFSTVRKTNLKAIKAHLRDGWKIVGEDTEQLHLIFDNKALI